MHSSTSGLDEPGVLFTTVDGRRYGLAIISPVGGAEPQALYDDLATVGFVADTHAGRPHNGLQTRRLNGPIGTSQTWTEAEYDRYLSAAETVLAKHGF